jgi:hypothetical protein
MQVNPFLIASLAATFLIDVLAPLVLATFLARPYQVAGVTGSTACWSSCSRRALPGFRP